MAGRVEIKGRLTGPEVRAREPWVMRREGRADMKRVGREVIKRDGREVTRRQGREVMRRGGREVMGREGREVIGREGQDHVAACAGSTGPLAFGEAAAPRGVEPGGQRSAECGDQAGYGVGGRGSVRAASDGCRVESRD